MYTKEAAVEFNRAYVDLINTPGMEKEAAEQTTLWTRERVREDGFWRKVLVPRTVSASELTRTLNSDLPVMIFDKETEQPPAASVPYGQAYMNWYMMAAKYMLTFSRIVSPRFMKDLSELRTYQIDIRQIFADNAVKDLLYEEDYQGISAVQVILGGSLGATAPMTGAVQWSLIGGGMSRDSWVEGKAIMGSTFYGVEPKLFCINNTFVRQFEKWGRDEFGGDLSERVFVNGLAQGKFGGMDYIVTIKKDIVANNQIYYFGDPQFIGHFCVLEEPTMWVKREQHSIEYQLSQEVGCVISHAAGLAIAGF